MPETKDLVCPKDKVHLTERLEHKNDDYTTVFRRTGPELLPLSTVRISTTWLLRWTTWPDYIHGSAKRIDMYKVYDINESVRKLADLINQGVLELARAIPELRNMSNMRVITDACVKINSLENHADDIYDRAIADLFDQESNAVELIKMREIYQALEIATDKCEDSANVMKTIIIKYA